MPYFYFEEPKGHVVFEPIIVDFNMVALIQKSIE